MNEERIILESYNEYKIILKKNVENSFKIFEKVLVSFILIIIIMKIFIVNLLRNIKNFFRYLGPNSVCIQDNQINI